MPYDHIEQDIVNALQHLPDISRTHAYRDSDWTNATKAIFGAIRYKNRRNDLTCQSWSGFNRTGQYTSREIRQHVEKALDLHVPDYLHEWLYDITWYDAKPGFVYDMPLVAESEWGKIEADGGVKEDFQKLLLARSKYRVMIFQCRKREHNALIEWFKEQIMELQFTQTDDRYLFCAFLWNARNQRFDFTHYVVPVNFR